MIKRTPDTGYDKQDAPLIEDIYRLLVERRTNALHAVARIVAGDGSKVAGTSDLDSKVLRLVDGYRKKYGDTDLN